MEHIKENQEIFEPYVEDDEPFDDYLFRMRRDAEWGGNQELVAASQLFKVWSRLHPCRFVFRVFGITIV